MPAPVKLTLERRIAPRRNTVLPATIVFNGGRTVLSCIIRNVSETGAKLQVSSVAAIPVSFDLLVDGHRPHACRVVWRSLKEIGVAYQ